MYWQFTGIGFGAGLLLAVINSLTHRLSACGLLRHEVQMNFWANLGTVLLVPIFIGLDLYLTEKPAVSKESCYSLFEIKILLGLFGFYLIKNVVLERSIMKRFVEDQHGAMPDFFEEATGTASPNRRQQVEMKPIVEHVDSDLSVDLEFDRNSPHSERFSSFHRRHYDRREIAEKRRTVNL